MSNSSFKGRGRDDAPGCGDESGCGDASGRSGASGRHGTSLAHSRREFLAHSAAGGLSLLTFNIAGARARMTAADARASNVPFIALEPGEVATIDALGETLLPGSGAAGLSHYLDQQLGGDPALSMLMIKYLRVNLPYIDFYRAGLRATESASSKLHRKAVPDLSASQIHELIAKMAAGQLEDWHGPPAPFFFFVMRSDAVDVTYGTEAGFASLGVPYMAHIAPPSRWGE